MDVLYEQYADGTFKFSDGTTLKASMTLLAFSSGVFKQLFHDSAPEHIVNVNDCDFRTFKLFLDCLFGFQEFSAEEALLIFPVAWKYEAEELIDKCLDILKPSVLNKNVCLSLNIALFWRCEKLIDSILNFLDEKKLMYQLLDEDQYYSHLEPESMLELLKRIELDSSILVNVIDWGNRYLEKQNKSITLKEFFTEQGVIDFVTFDCFETGGTFLQFMKSDVGKKFFTSSDLGNYVEKYGFDGTPITWVKYKKGDTLIEKFLVKNVCFTEKCVTKLKFYRNQVIIYNVPDDAEDKLLLYTFSYKIIDSKGLKITDKNEGCVRRHTASKKNGMATLQLYNKSNMLSDVEVTVKMNFIYDCRIMKSPPKNILPRNLDSDNWVFFKEAEIVYEKGK